jgi:hypothetical protein
MLNDEVKLQGFDDAGALSETSLARHAVLIPDAYSEKLIRMRYSKSTYDKLHDTVSDVHDVPPSHSARTGYRKDRYTATCHIS